MIAMIIHTQKNKNKKKNLENLSTAFDPHVQYSVFSATGMRVNYYILIEPQQNIILSDYPAQVLLWNVIRLNVTIKMSSFCEACRAVYWILIQPTTHLQPLQKMLTTHTYMSSTDQLYFL